MRRRAVQVFIVIAIGLAGTGIYSGLTYFFPDLGAFVPEHIAVAASLQRVDPPAFGSGGEAPAPAGAVATQARRGPMPGGTNAWRLRRPADQHQIEGYSLQSSVDPGEPVVLRVSTTAPQFHVQAYRFGWYRGGQAHLVWDSPSIAGARQPGPSFTDREMRTVVAPWANSMTVSTTGWPAGAYVLKLVASTGWQSYVPLFVHAPTSAGTVALVAPVATWEAYNTWGGYSLYSGPPGDRRSWAVGFDRPFGGQGLALGAADMLYGVRPVVIEAERTAVPLSYLTDLDLDADPGVLSGARAYVSMGHDEYWTRTMRRAVLTARDHGTNLAFLGADIEFWRIRLAASSVGARRTVVGYRWDYAQDPLRSRHPELSTAPFGFAPGAQPEEALTGTRYECFPVDAPYIVTSPGWWGFRGTGVRAGDRFAHLVGIEADRVYPGPSTPRPQQILSSTAYSCRGVATSAQSVYFTTTSGAGVFTTGTLRWTCALEQACGGYEVTPAAKLFTRRVTANVLRAFAAGPAGRGHPAHDNVAAYHLPSQHTVPAD